MQLGRSLLWGFNQKAHWTGLRVRALIALITEVAAITSANWRNICPLMPGKNAAGRKTATRASVIPMIGPVNSCIALIVAFLGVIPRSMWYEAPSTTTIASSTTMPMARMRAKSVIRLTVNPSAAIAMKAPMMVTGTVVAGTSIARKFWRKRSTTIRTRTAAMKRVSYTFEMASRTNWVVSYRIPYLSPSGKSLLISAIAL